ncbi:MAG: hypothetical protein PWP64_145 [Candidatus Cloacimonadota bacterium]|nr:hypothetical protein [Candidatus Cloacimonadota bacterium]
MHNPKNRQYISFREMDMLYDPLKDRIAGLIKVFPACRRLFYLMLNFLLLRQRYVFAEIRRYFRDGMRFYDAGAGFCQYSDFVLRHYPHARVFATDLKSEYLSDYKAVAGSRFFYQTADLQVFCPQYHYDMAIAIDILEHIPDDVNAMKNIYQALAPDGILIISTPSDLDEAAKFTEEHVRPGYNKLELETKLTKIGFTILSSRYSYGHWGALSWKLLIKYPLALWAKCKPCSLLLPFWYLILFPLAQLLMWLDMNTRVKQGTGIIVVAQAKKGEG